MSNEINPVLATRVVSNIVEKHSYKTFAGPSKNAVGKKKKKKEIKTLDITKVLRYTNPRADLIGFRKIPNDKLDNLIRYYQNIDMSCTCSLHHFRTFKFNMNNSSAETCNEKFCSR